MIFFVSRKSTTSFQVLPIVLKNSMKMESSRRDYLKRKGKSQEEIESDKLQAELNKLTAEVPMFASFDAANIDQSALPIPAFTAAIIFLGSLFCTFYLYDIGLNGFPAN